MYSKKPNNLHTKKGLSLFSWIWYVNGSLHSLFRYKYCTNDIILQSTYEETRLNESDMGDKTRWLKEGMECSLLYWKDKVHTLVSR